MTIQILPCVGGAAVDVTAIKQYKQLINIHGISKITYKTEENFKLCWI
jgi:hypothetical protein